MKLLIWILFAVGTLLWTGAAALTSRVIQAISQALQSGTTADLASWVSSWSVPTWLLAVIDVQGVQAVQLVLVQILDHLPRAWPMGADLIGWLVPAVWVAWMLAVLLMLAVAIGLHRLVSAPAG